MSTQTQPCGTGADDATIGSFAWTLPGNITASDNVYAIASPGTGISTHYLKATNFGFTIPAGATIDNVEFRFERKGTGSMVDTNVRMVRGGVISSTNKSAGAAWAASDQVDSFSFTPTGWGEATLSDTEVNASNFGVVVACTSATTGTASVDFVDCIVTYTIADESSSSSASSSSSTSLSSSSTSSLSSSSSSSSSSLSSSSSTSSSSGVTCVPATYADFVKETSSTAGLGTLDLDGAVAGYSNFQTAVASQSRVPYAAADGLDFEVGIGTFTLGSPNTLTRDVIIASSNAHLPVNWLGDKNVGIVLPSLSRLPRGYIDGYVLANNASDPDNRIDISLGTARDACHQVDIENTAAVTKRLDAAWAAGSGSGGRFAGVALSTGTWYHVFALFKDSGRLVDFGFDTSPNAVNRPAGYSLYRLIGSILTDGSSKIVRFAHTSLGGTDFFRWATPTLDVDDSTVSSGGEAKPVRVPTGRRVVAVLDVQVDCPALSDNDEAAYFYDDLVAAMAAATGSAPLASLGFQQTSNTSGAETRGAAGQVLAVTNSAAAVNVATRNGFGVRIVTVGWLDPRGRGSSA